MKLLNLLTKNDMKTILIQILSTFPLYISVYLISQGIRKGWIVNIIANIGLIIYGIVIHQYVFAVMQIPFVVMSFQAFRNYQTK